MTTGAEDLGRLTRHLIRGTDTATLCTSLADGTGWPYASLVLVAFAYDGSPLLLLSDLAEHSKALAMDDRLSLLFDGTSPYEERLTGPRASVLGRARQTSRPEHRARFLARHPSAAGYAGFGDFRFYAVSVERAHLVAGFGRISWLPREAVCGQSSPGATLAGAEEEIVSHMNEDHADAVDLYANVILGVTGTGWKMTGIDEEGCDLRLQGRVARLPFEARVRTPAEARAELVRLVGVARRSSAT